MCVIDPEDVLGKIDDGEIHDVPIGAAVWSRASFSQKKISQREGRIQLLADLGDPVHIGQIRNVARISAEIILLAPVESLRFRVGS